MDVEIFKFKSTDGTHLDGFLNFNKEKSNSVIITVHGMASNCFKKKEKVISEYALKNNIDTFIFNNRGSDIVRYLKKDYITPGTDNFGGSAYENPYDSYYDIKGAILLMIEKGYTNIYLCGHSLGATKILYTYNKFIKDNDEILKYVKAVIFLSLIDLENCFKFFAGNKYNDFVNYASIKKEQKKDFEMMPNNSFLHPLSVRTYLLYNKNNEDLNISRYSDKNYDFKELNNIKVPIFMRWGTDHEFIIQKRDELIHILKNKVKNNNLNIGFIEGADHNYRKKEDYVAKEIIDFIINIK